MFPGFEVWLCGALPSACADVLMRELTAHEALKFTLSQFWLLCCRKNQRSWDTRKNSYDSNVIYHHFRTHVVPRHSVIMCMESSDYNVIF